MARKHLMIAINWYGPYSLDEAREAASSSWDQGLYLCIGMLPYERSVSIQYIGIGTSVSTRLNDRHHKLKAVTREREIWLGEIATAEPTGRAIKVTPASLDNAEWMHIRFVQPRLNEKKAGSLPSRGVTVLNRWFKTDEETARKQRPHPDWPDLIDFPGYDMPARSVWFGGRQELFHYPDYFKNL